MNIIMHKSCDVKRYKGQDGRELIAWGRRYTNSLNKRFLDQLQDATDRHKPLSLECNEEPGIFIINNPDKGVMLYSDFALPTSFYYSIKNGNLYCGNTDKKVAELIDGSRKIDFTGVYQRLSLGYTVGHRTRFQAVSVLEPGTIVFAKGQGTERVVLSYIAPGNVSIEDLYEAFKEEITGIGDKTRLGIMLSAGYDSRVLLGICNELKIRLDTAYTHGLLRSMEVKVAYQLAKETSVRRILQVDAGKEMFGSVNEIKSFFERIGFLYNPCWRLAGEYFKARDLLPICGVQAEILNGQYLQGSRSVTSYRLKYAIIKRGYKNYIMDKTGFAHFCFQSPQDHLVEFLRPQLQKRIQEFKETTKADLISIAEAYRNSCASWEEAFIRFLTEHDGSKLMAQQAEILRQYTPVLTPFTGRKVVALCSSFDNQNKTLGKAMRQILRKYAPQLSKYRCTKSLLPVWCPDALHFLGRALAPAANKFRIRRFLAIKGKGRYLPVKHSWEGGDIWIRENSEIAELRNVLNGNILDFHTMNGWLDAIQSYKIAVGDAQDLLRVLELDLLSNSKPDYSIGDMPTNI